MLSNIIAIGLNSVLFLGLALAGSITIYIASYALYTRFIEKAA